MSQKNAKTYVNISNRAKSRESSDRRFVYKSTLDNPFRVPWPSIPLNVQNMALAQVLALLQDISPFRLGKKPKLETPSSSGLSVITGLENSAADVLLHHLSVGINEVTKQLERLSNCLRNSSEANQRKSPTIESRTVDVHVCAQVVFVCRSDVDPPDLIAHLPSLVATCNSLRMHPTAQSSEATLLIQLPQGSETKLAELLGIRRASVISIDRSALGLSNLRDFLETLPVITAPWLNPVSTSAIRLLQPTHTKQFSTTTPLEMKKRKEQRKQGRTAAKERKKALAEKIKQSKTPTTATALMSDRIAKSSCQ